MELGGGGTVWTNDSAYSASFSVRPSALYMLEDGLAVGGLASVGYSRIRQGGYEPETISFSFGPRFAANIELGSRFSLLLGTSLQYAAFFAKSDSSASTATTHVLYLSLSAPFLFHVADHFFVGLGPSFGQDIIRKTDGSSTDRSATSFGVGLTVGGWFDS